MFKFFEITPKERNVRIKKKKGVLYSNPTGFRRKLFYFGNGVILGAICYGIYLYYPLGKAIANYNFAKSADNEVASIELIEENFDKEEFVVRDFKIQIPKILASATVEPDISPFNPKEYLSILSEDKVAHSKTSAKPGAGKGSTIYIFAHSTEQGLNMVRKNSVFYLLGELSTGDKVYLKYGDRIHTYEVYDKKVVGAKEVHYLEYSDPTMEMLILQTCWPIGTDWKRLLVFGKLLN
ncbi:MAG: sortase [Patescibacteria group bacterium]|jgi:LPXTG-site transpeptidase (sortase) family protein